MEWLLYFAMLFAAALSLGLAILQLPGLWLMLAFAAGYAWMTHAQLIGPTTLIILFGLALIAEVFETLATASGAKVAGASKTAMVLAMAGAVAGGLFFTLIPIPVISTIVGVCFGAFTGAVLGEKFRGRSDEQSLKSGVGAVVGRLMGTLLKLFFGMAMLLLIVLMAAPIRGCSSRTTATYSPAPTTQNGQP